MRRLVCVTLFVATILGAVACQGRPTLGPVACPLVLISGALVEDGGTVAIQVATGRTQPVVWPDGVTVARTESGLALVGFFGQTIAREGDVIEMGGGYSAGDVYFQGCGEIAVVSPGS